MPLVWVISARPSYSLCGCGWSMGVLWVFYGCRIGVVEVSLGVVNPATSPVSVKNWG